MKMSEHLRSSSIRPCCFVLLLAGLLATAPVLGQRRFSLGGPPLELEDVLRYLTTRYRSGTRAGQLMVPQDDLSKGIRNRNVAFELDDKTLQQLKDAGAGDAVLAAIRHVRPPKPEPPEPLPPPKPPTGALTIRCSPAECNVMVESDRFEETKGGVLEKLMPVGRHTVTISREGYVTDQQSIDLKEAGTQITVSLQPTPATKARIGNDLVKRMLQACGDDSAEIMAKGSWTRTTSGIPMELTFGLRSGPKQTALILNSEAGGLQIVCEGEICGAKKDVSKELRDLRPRRQLKTEDAVRREAELKFFRRFFLPNVIREIRSGLSSARLRPTADADSAGPDGHYRVSLESNDERYSFELDAQYLPVELTHDLGPNLDRRNIATYSEYVEAGAGKYPRRITIKAPEEGLIRVRFDAIQLVTN
jgi:hypothetical protein